MFNYGKTEQNLYYINKILSKKKTTVQEIFSNVKCIFILLPTVYDLSFVCIGFHHRRKEFTHNASGEGAALKKEEVLSNLSNH